MTLVFAPAVWQWSIDIPGVVSPETGGAPRAFLWVPPASKKIRGIIVGQQSMQEQTILEDRQVRGTLERVHFAVIWITPALDLAFDVAAGAGRHFDSMLAALAEKSGYAELSTAPILPLGHSAAASFPWRFARWSPKRTLAVVSISGAWPYPVDEQSPIVRDPALAGIPGLVVLGEYESALARVAEGLGQRAADATLPLTMLAEPGGGHFDASDEKLRYLSLYIHYVAEYRLPLAGSSELRFIDPEAQGWLVDGWRGDEPPRVPPAPVAEYAEPEEAFWCFNQEHARITERFLASQRGKRHALLGFVQDDKVLPQIPGSHQQVTIPFQPLEDGLTFRLRGEFLATVPQGRPEQWTGLKAGTSIDQPTSQKTISIERIDGPVKHLSSDTFAIRFDRTAFGYVRGATEIWLAAIFPGDAQFRRCVQQARLRIPLRNTEGGTQRITFAPIPDQQAHDLPNKTIPLVAHSTAPAEYGAVVRFYVQAGPARVSDDGLQLTFDSVPDRARLPLEVTVVAWQWGRSIEPKLQSAEPVARTFRIVA